MRHGKKPKGRHNCIFAQLFFSVFHTERMIGLNHLTNSAMTGQSASAILLHTALHVKAEIKATKV